MHSPQIEAVRVHSEITDSLGQTDEGRVQGPRARPSDFLFRLHDESGEFVLKHASHPPWSGADTQPVHGGLRPVYDARLLAEQIFMLAIRLAGILFIGRRNGNHSTEFTLARQCAASTVEGDVVAYPCALTCKP